MLAQLLIPSRIIVLFFVFFLTSSLYGFSFSEAEEEDLAEEESRSELIQQLKSTSCSKRLKNKKIAVIIGQKRSNGISTHSKNTQISNYINRSLRKLGLRTYTQSQIKQQIANAEIKAYLKGDTNGAISAARRLAANFMLKGIVRIHEGVNKKIGIDEVSVNMTFTLQDRRGNVISSVEATDHAYSGSDTFSAAIDLAKEQGDVVVAKLYSEYCMWAR